MAEAPLWHEGRLTVKIKMLLCNCKGLCASFKDTNMNTLPFQVESDLDVEYTVLHPQLCGQGGNVVLTEALQAADDETYVVVGACAPEVQQQLFKKLLRTTGFDERRFVPVDIRGTDNEGILGRLRSAVETLIQQPAGVAAK
jgi:heterodisulfide reductase subunit A-like polyferredoxin